MSFDYDKIRSRSENANDSFWTSYADLYTMLSLVFLFLYVAASLRSGTQGAVQGAQIKQLSKKNQDLEQQLKVYTTLKDDSLSNQSEQEKEVYKKLMSKLSLLKEEAGQEKDELRKKAKENEEKEFALNQYQQVIRNIIDANVLAKSQIKRRDQTIVEKKQELAQKSEVISDLNQEISAKEQLIVQNEEKIESINDQLASQIKRLKATQTKAKMSKAELNKQIARLKDDSAQKVAALQEKNSEFSQELISVKTNLTVAERRIQQQEQKARGLQSELEQTRAQGQAEMDRLKGEYAERLSKEKADFNRNLAAKEMTALQRGKALEAFQARARAEQAELQGKLAALGSKINQAEGQLSEARGQANRAMASLQGERAEKEQLKGDLARAQELANARKNLVKQIKDSFGKAGIKADVNEKTGQVTLSFGEDYFDTGSSELSTRMQSVLNKFIPAYSKALFEDPKTADAIQNVEITGFASSTYKGKYVDPTSIKPKDQEAVNYNLKLSFGRANAIFKHIFDTKKLSYEHQKALLPMVKVVGQGYLPEGKTGKDIPEGMGEKEFCSKYNCKQAQKVVIKFNLKE